MMKKGPGPFFCFRFIFLVETLAVLIPNPADEFREELDSYLAVSGSQAVDKTVEHWRVVRLVDIS